MRWKRWHNVSSRMSKENQEGESEVGVAPHLQSMAIVNDGVSVKKAPKQKGQTNDDGHNADHRPWRNTSTQNGIPWARRVKENRYSIADNILGDALIEVNSETVRVIYISSHAYLVLVIITGLRIPDQTDTGARTADDSGNKKRAILTINNPPFSPVPTQAAQTLKEQAFFRVNPDEPDGQDEKWEPPTSHNNAPIVR